MYYFLRFNCLSNLTKYLLKVRIRKKFQNYITQQHMASYIPVGKIAKKAVCRSVFLTISHGILSAKLTKTPFRLFFLAILPTGKHLSNVLLIPDKVAFKSLKGVRVM